MLRMDSLDACLIQVSIGVHSSLEWVWHQTFPLGMTIVVSHHGQWETFVPRGVQGLHFGTLYFLAPHTFV